MRSFWVFMGGMLFPAVSMAAVDFSRDVRPILSQYCFQCHGPDEAARKGGLRLDLRDSAYGKGKSGEVAIVPGKSAASEVIKRIDHADATELMPPPATKKPLSSKQREILTRWIDEGAIYQDHWAFLAPKQAPLPSVKLSDRLITPIDRFIVTKLEASGLTLNPPAKETLVRRVFLDLIGLPPTPEEAAAFFKDESPDAYAKLVERLLKSPHYGERWARKWLDLARYADTNGFEKDRARSMWPYRDWVIRAINANMPFDRFTIEQLAGDLLPGATEEQRIATGFHRNTMTNEEGGIDPLEFRWHSVNDRVATTGTTWLGLTLNCCQCHNHKFDPVSQAEYYKIFAFLNNADEPTMDVKSTDIAAKRDTILKQIAEREQQLIKKISPENFKKWQEAERPKAIAWHIAEPIEATANIPTLNRETNGIIFVSGDMSKRDIYTLKFKSVPKNTTALRIEIFPDPRLPANGPGRVSYEGPFGDFFLTELTLKSGDTTIPLGLANGSGHDGKNKPEHAVDGNVLTGWSINGKQGQANNAVFNLKKPLEADTDLQLDLLFEKYYAAGLGKFRVSFTKADIPVESRAVSHEAEEAMRIDPAKLSDEQRNILSAQYVTIASELQTERADIAKLRTSLPKFPTTLVMQERPAGQTRPTPVYKRGEYNQPTTPVTADVPAILPSLPKDLPKNRLAFAKWLVDTQNPLTARVIVNRQWAAFFGRGIVRTLEDFGYQGDAPTHPELLDWLAVEFMKSGWDMKNLHRLIVTSATYRQSSEVHGEQLKTDPKNQLLARFPRQRLEAEILRDQALTASGLLSRKIGGPSVFPPQPPGVTSEGTYGGLTWNASAGEDRYRRGFYTYVKRTAPYAMFQTFDGPSGEFCTARREVSNTPLQALTILNDAVFQELAQTMAKQLTLAPGDTDAKLKMLWNRCMTRPPTTDELTTLRTFFNTQKARFEKLPKEANTVAGPGDGDPVQRAAWTATVRVVFNLDEMVTKE
ncbi:PSD1 and planctomycete cytochrome C domain-containing protein [Zavarzinella formosa]|uniref:PSD1 and planctomycete cytochrome C domain-containing protein n=1 Tax=Zavarzinella formosa TaxID=360055 RepID=UPI0002D2AA12|nr:PSD1 and planctomycete cytochrome C domain-containing protein [Zavarzinella formosa]